MGMSGNYLYLYTYTYARFYVRDAANVLIKAGRYEVVGNRGGLM